MQKKLLKITQMEIDMIDLIKAHLQGECTIAQIAYHTGYSEKQIERKLKRYQEEGSKGMIHKNQGRIPANKISPELEKQLVDTYVQDFMENQTSFKHYCEFVKIIFGIEISRQTMTNIMKRNGILSPYAHKKTVNEFKQKQEQQENIVEIDGVDFEFVESIGVLDFEPHRRRPRVATTGYLLQMDAGFIPAPNDQDKNWAIHVAIDDATSTITGIHFALQETTNGYFHVMDQTLRNYGAPKHILTDKRSTFCVNNKKKSSFENDFLTNFEMTCMHYQIELHTSSIPQHKGRVERCVGTIKRRIIAELAFNNITSLDEANAFGPLFIAKLNKQFALPLNNIKSSWQSVNTDDIEYHLCTHHPRTVAKGNVIYFENNIYYTNSDSVNVNIIPGRKGLVIRTFTGKLFFYCCGKYYEMIQVPEHEIKDYSYSGVSRNPRFPATEEQKALHSYSCFYIKQFKKAVSKQKHLSEKAKKLTTSF